MFALALGTRWHRDTRTTTPILLAVERQVQGVPLRANPANRVADVIGCRDGVGQGAAQFVEQVLYVFFG